MLRRVVWWTLTDVSGELTALITEAVRTSETSVNIHQTTWCNIPEYSHLHIRRCENLKSHTHCIRPSIVL
jgi:hypothetical protein